MSLKVILFAGTGGQKLYPLTERTAKCLLPVGNRPLISYQLEMLEKAGLNELMLVTHDSALSGLKEYIREKYSKFTIDFVSFSDELTITEALGRIKHKIKSDFLVISGDLIVTPHAIHKLVDRHREQGALVTMLLSFPHVEEGEKKKKGGEQADLIGLDPTQKKVLCYFSGENIEFEHLKFKRSFFSRFPNVKLYSTLIDSHLYLFSPEALERLEDKDFESLRDDFIPYLSRYQFRKKKVEVSLTATVDESEVENQINKNQQQQQQQHGHCQCYCFVLDEGFCLRVNSLDSYLKANREVSAGNVGYLPSEKKGKDNFIAEGAKISPKTAIGADCIVGVSEVGDRTSVKKSVIGNNCQIGNNVKLVNSVIMDHVVVADNCVIQNSVLCHKSSIGEKSKVENSVVGGGIKITAESDLKNEKRGIADLGQV